MRKKTRKEQQEIQLRKIEEACKRYSLGRNSIRKVAEEANAVVRVGKHCMINITELDRYLDNLCE